MTNQEILTKAIDKAAANGWRAVGNFVPHVMEGVDYSNIIYSHDFAKALWGTEWPDGPGGTGLAGFTSVARWKAHLSEMVVAEDPIAYLGANI